LFRQGDVGDAANQVNHQSTTRDESSS
jgi:hypothetical protein